MTRKQRNALFRELREEAKRINAWEALELIQQAQTAFDCADCSFDDKGYSKQSKKIDKIVAKIRKILPESPSTKRLEKERRLYQAAKDSPIHDDIGDIDPSLCWCSDDD